VRCRTDLRATIDQKRSLRIAQWCFMSPMLPTRTRSSSSLTPADYARLAPHLHTVKLESGALIGRLPGESNFAYFPTICVVSLICEMEWRQTRRVDAEQE
jgi:hypothetical protein